MLDHFVLLIYPTSRDRAAGRLRALVQRVDRTIEHGVRRLRCFLAAGRLARRPLEPPQHDGGLLYRIAACSLAGAGFGSKSRNAGRGDVRARYVRVDLHPVGMAMLIEASNARGRTLAFNGVCGNLGVSLAVGYQRGACHDRISWRAALFVPAVVMVATGIVYLWLTPDDGHHANRAVSAPAVPLTPRLAVMLFGLFIVIALSAGLTFNVLTIALPKIVDERLSNDLPLIFVAAVIATAVLVCARACATDGRAGCRGIPPACDIRDRDRHRLPRQSVGGLLTSGVALLIALAVAIAKPSCAGGQRSTT